MAAAPSTPFFDYPALFRRDEENIMEVLRDVLRRGAFVLQKDLAEFEAALGGYLGVRHAFGVADGTNALILGLKAAGIGPGDEVILPSHTYIASAASIHMSARRPCRPTSRPTTWSTPPRSKTGSPAAPRRSWRSSSTAAPATWTPCRPSPTVTG